MLLFLMIPFFNANKTQLQYLNLLSVLLNVDITILSIPADHFLLHFFQVILLTYCTFKVLLQYILYQRQSIQNFLS